MCGIAGFLETRPAASNPAERIARAMGDTIVHRGPDEGDVWVDGEAGIALSHRRLSIIDLSPAGHQPMKSADGRWVIAFNGEIYNFEDLRELLTGRGHTFRGHSDTEVLLAAVSEWGVREAAERCNGMFALALWDQRDRVLHLARDRFGEKPLYYGWCGGLFLFGSELKAIRRHPGFTAEFDRDAIALFLRHGYVPDPFSVYRGFAKLLPGHLAAVSAANPGQVRLDEYWPVRDLVARGLQDPHRGTEQEIAEELDGVLRDAVKIRTYADVPLGAFLSGGVDSSTIVALMQAQSTRPVKTFTIGFGEDAYNEAAHAKRVAQHLGTDHTELYVTAQDALNVVPLLPSLYDEPFADSSQIPTYLVSQMARRHVTVSLSGDAGDELFGGYTRYFLGSSLWNGLARFPLWLRSGAAAALRTLPTSVLEAAYRLSMPILPRGLRLAGVRDKVQKAVEILGVRTPEAMYLRLVSLWKEPAQVVIASKEPRPPRWDLGPLSGIGFPEKMMFLDLVSYLPGDILVKVDRASMGVSLEARVPFLDPRVAELAWRIPTAMKMRSDVGKRILRKVLYKYVPPELIDRPKMGFGVPVSEWLRGPLREWAVDLLAEARLRRQGLFDPAQVLSLLDQHLRRGRDYPYHLWAVLMFQGWLDSLEAPRA